MGRTLTYLLLFLIASCFQLQSQSDFEFIEYINKKNGLPSDHIYSVIEDSKGFVWMATNRGVVKYDGTTFKVFTTSDGLPTNDVFDLKEDKWGRIWCMTVSNFIVYIRDDEVHDVKSSLGNIYFYDFAEDDQGISYFRNWETLVELDDKAKVLSEEDDLDNRYAIRFRNALEPNITIEIFEDGQMLSTTYPRSHFPSNLTRLFQFNKNYLYFFDLAQMSIGVIDLYQSRKIQIALPRSKRGNAFIHKIRSNKGKIELVVGQEFYSYDPYIDSLSRKMIDVSAYCRQPTSFIQVSNLLFVSSLDKGLLVLRNTSNSKVKSYPRSNITSITAVNDSLIAIGDRYGSVFTLSQNLEARQLLEQGKSEENVRITDLYYEYEKRKLWVQSASLGPGYFEIGGSGNFQKTQVDFLNYNKTIPVDDTSKIKISSRHISLVVANKENNQQEILLPKQAHCHIHHGHKIYFGLSQGLLGYDVNSKTTKEFKFSGNIKSLSTHRDRILLGTEGQGLFIFDEENDFQSLALPGLSISDIKKDGREIFLATNAGIFTMDSSTFDINQYYSQANGLKNRSVDFIHVNKQSIFAQNSYGIEVLSRDGARITPEVSIYIDEQELRSSDTISLDSLRAFEFTIGSINYDHIPMVRKVSFSTGKDDFRSLDQSFVSFRDISPGHYQLKIYAENEHYKFKTKTITKTIIVPAKYYETYWFWALVLLALLAISVYLTDKRFKTIRRRSEDKLRLEKEYAMIELQSLQSQLNPHFIFNCLNSIQALINARKTNQASDYLTKFSNLMQKFLDQSSDHLTTLEEELEINRIYLELEKLRFKDKLEYEIIIDSSVHDLEIEIPAVIIQPIVENAIRHGIFHKEGPGMVTIKVSQHAKILTIEVKDDGIGFEAASKIRNNDQHKSMATSLLNRKRELLEIAEKVTITHHVIHLSPGTIVVITIPLH